MLATFINLVDRILQILRLRESRKDRRFEKLWKPTFEDLRGVHSNYLQILMDCLVAFEEIDAFQDIVETQQRLADMRNTLSGSRLEFESIRGQLLAFIKQAQKYGYNDSEEKFIQSLVHYFPSIANRTLSTAASETLTLLEALNEVLTSDEYEPQYFSDSVSDVSLKMEKTLRKMRLSWDSVCDSYSVLQHENSRLDL